MLQGSYGSITNSNRFVNRRIFTEANYNLSQAVTKEKYNQSIYILQEIRNSSII